MSVRVNRVFGVLIKRQEPGTLALQFGGHKDLFIADCEMYQTAFEHEQGLSRVSISLVLLDCIVNYLTGKRVLQLCCYNRDTVQEDSEV